MADDALATAATAELATKIARLTGEKGSEFACICNRPTLGGHVKLLLHPDLPIRC